MNLSQATHFPTLIAVTGQEGSGKDSYAEHLAAQGYMHISAGDVIRQAAVAHGYAPPFDRDTLSKVGDELKRKFGSSPIVANSMQSYEQAAPKPKGLVISGIRRVGEIEAFKSHGAVIVWINADEKQRFNNQKSRARIGDELDLDAFVLRGKKEYFGDTQGGHHGVNLRAIEALADCKVSNDGTLEDLFHKADTALAEQA